MLLSEGPLKMNLHETMNAVRLPELSYHTISQLTDANVKSVLDAVEVGSRPKAPYAEGAPRFYDSKKARQETQPGGN